MSYFLWMTALIGVVFFLKYGLYPYLLNRYIFWKVSRTLRKIAKNHKGDPELHTGLTNLADKADNLSREESIYNNYE